MVPNGETGEVDIWAIIWYDRKASFSEGGFLKCRRLTVSGHSGYITRRGIKNGT